MSVYTTPSASDILHIANAAGIGGTSATEIHAYLAELGTRAAALEAVDTALAARLPAAAKWTTGTGTPEAAVIGSIGDLYTDLAGGATTTLYVKTSGAATNTGWTAK